MTKKSLFTPLMSQSRVQNWNHQSSKNQIVNDILDERFFNGNNLNKFQTLSCSTWKHSCSRSQWYICGQGKEWKTARVTKWQQLAFINLSNTQIHTELLDTLDGYARAHGTKVLAHTESNKVMGTRQHHISEACLPGVHGSYFPRDDNTLISHAPLKLFLEWRHWGLTETADCWLLSFPRQRHFGLTHFWYMLMHWELLWQKGESFVAFWNICDMYHRRKKVYSLFLYSDISGSHVFFVASSLCGYICCLLNLLLPLRFGHFGWKIKTDFPSLADLLEVDPRTEPSKAKGKTRKNSEMNQDPSFKEGANKKPWKSNSHTSTACTWNSLGKGSFLFLGTLYNLEGAVAISCQGCFWASL